MLHSVYTAGKSMLNHLRIRGHGMSHSDVHKSARKRTWASCQTALTSSSELTSELAAGRRERVRAGVGCGAATPSKGSGHSASGPSSLPCSATARSRTAISSSSSGAAEAPLPATLVTCHQ